MRKNRHKALCAAPSGVLAIFRIAATLPCLQAALKDEEPVRLHPCKLPSKPTQSFDNNSDLTLWDMLVLC